MTASTRFTADDWIARLELEKHPEGGWYREVYRSPEAIPADALPRRFGVAHPFSTSIYFLLRGGECAALHRLPSDEVWHFYLGSPIVVDSIAPDGSLARIRLSADGPFQGVVPAGHWFGASVEEASPDAFALVGCTVAPGVRFEDLELASRADLVARFPQHRVLIERLTSAVPGTALR